MARLFGFFANQSDRVRCALALDGAALSLTPGEPVEGWGVGSYQTGDVLLRRKPTESRTDLVFGEQVQNLRTDAAIVHLRGRETSARTLENTHPFRYREWLFAHTGSIDSYARIRGPLLESIPEFLRKDIRGDTDSEVLFHVVLSFLHDAGRLHDGGADPRTLIGALSSAASLIDHLIGEVGGRTGFPLNAL